MAKDTNAPAVSMTMTPEEFAELRAQAASLGQQDVVLGRVLNMIVLHLGHAHDLDPTVEDARLAKEAEDAKAAEEAASVEQAPVEPVQEGA